MLNSCFKLYFSTLMHLLEKGMVVVMCCRKSPIQEGRPILYQLMPKRGRRIDKKGFMGVNTCTRTLLVNLFVLTWNWQRGRLLGLMYCQCPCTKQCKYMQWSCSKTLCCNCVCSCKSKKRIWESTMMKDSKPEWPSQRDSSVVEEFLSLKC